MSFYNNQSNCFVNFNSVDEAHNSAQSSCNDHSNLPKVAPEVSVSYSTLEPTAQEFHPANQSGSINGAVKKKTQNERSKYRDNGRGRNNRYGSGRTFNGSKYDYNNKIDRSTNDEERNKILQDTASFLRNSSHEKSENVDEDSLSHSGSYSVTNLSRENRNSTNFGRDQQEQYNKNYGNQSKYNENIETTYQKPKASSENQRSFQSRHFKGSGRVNDKANRSSFHSKYERSYNYYENSERNSSFNRHNQSYSYQDKPGKSYNYCDKKSSFYDNSCIDSVDKSERNNADQFDNRYNYYEGMEGGYGNNFKSGFKPYDNRNGNKYGEGKNQRDWRKSNQANRDKTSKDFIVKSKKKFDAASQRERLEEMLNRRLLECLICCEKIKHIDKVWNCMQCYHILHLSCVAAWAKSSKVENGWRCPACQNVCTDVPIYYMCYCSKKIDPRYDPSTIPHGCGEICLRKGRTCEHKCTILCHPGPCPDCNVMVSKPCGCGSTQQVVKCSTDIEIVCDSICNKTLDCGIHKCKSRCHSGNCSSCSEIIIQECYCGKVGRKVSCSAEFSGSTQYACEDICGKTLTCGNHKCQRICHEGLCDTCIRDVNIIHTCPCGKTPLEIPRTSCLDSIPCCDKICGRSLKCGQPSLPHKCRELCHEGICPCPLTTVVRCRCGHMDKELPCEKLTTKADDARCEKKCTKKRMCGKHRCNQRCCIEIEHFCPLPCNHQLSCGQHRCERTCHSGRCPPCMETSFEELYCECGASVIYPPIPCGTKPPNCTKPCSRQRACSHDANHSCHIGPCPPCTVLCKRWCHGHHEQRSAIPCHQETFSCGLPCGRKMPCGRHKCNKPCHEGPCPMPCKQPCNVRRILCGHPCGKPCHDPPCPESSCKQNVPVTCSCGLQKSTRPCIDVAEEFRNIEMAQLKEKMSDLSKDQTVDISDIISKPKKPSVLKILECTEECHVLERNRRLAIGLQIRNPDLSQKLTPKYTDFMRQWAKKDPHFCQRIHDKLTELVQLAKQSKQKSRSYSFDSMNRDKRHFIHEYCEHFGVESAAYDMEPNRNIVATANKDKSWLPSMSLLEVIQRENGQRKVPGPISVLSKTIASKPETVSLRLPCQMQRSSTHPGEFVDYFDPPV
ncbi:hypothetical protein NQ314_000502 [Rhamnusium bicolor]|uniref:Protein shuttle craft n=2 Tax=Rhamnusium bicolor TaxID=1586634 RepID=A0AAV8ZX30_9CUCU|nr:hypothetical protein NQ314_000502 [Rhamnusium bicolor]